MVVVSEETGAISYAHKGQFVRGVTLEQLRAFLTSILVKGSKQRRTLVEWVRSWTVDRVKPGAPMATKAETR